MEDQEILSWSVQDLVYNKYEVVSFENTQRGKGVRVFHAFAVARLICYFFALSFTVDY